METDPAVDVSVEGIWLYHRAKGFTNFVNELTDEFLGFMSRPGMDDENISWIAYRKYQFPGLRGQWFRLFKTEKL
jgi:hypothetical protein